MHLEMSHQFLHQIIHLLNVELWLFLLLLDSGEVNVLCSFKLISRHYLFIININEAATVKE